MSDSLFGSLMGELSRYLHFASGFFESPLIGYNIYHVAGPGVYARQLVGVLNGFIPGHALALGTVTTEDKALSGA